MTTDEKRWAIEDAIAKHPDASQAAIAKEAGVSQCDVSNYKACQRQPDRPAFVPAVTAHIIWRETDSRLETMAAHVREGVDVDAASEFSRWLNFSGIVDILPEQPFPLPCHPVELRSKLAKLVSDCGEWFASHERSRVKPHAQIPKTELERINSQLGDLHRAIAKIAEATGTGNTHVPELKIMQGGVPA